MSDQKVWFITGAGRGMGTDMAKAALDAGHTVAAGRNTDAVTQAIGEHDDLLVARLDVTSAEESEGAVKAAVERFGRLDVLVNNAGNFSSRRCERSCSASARRSSNRASSAPTC